MSNDTRTLIKVELTYQDEKGKSRETLEGEQANEWLKVVNGYLALQQLRQGRDKRLGQFKWTEERL